MLDQIYELLIVAAIGLAAFQTSLALDRYYSRKGVEPGGLVILALALVVMVALGVCLPGWGLH
jgi:hypothetical protein